MPEKPTYVELEEKRIQKLEQAEDRLNQSETALRQCEAVMRYIIKHDPNAIAVYDKNLNYIAVSDRYLQDYNVGERDILGKHHYEVFPEMPQRWKEVHQRVLQGVTERNENDHFQRPDGRTTYNRWECRPWYLADGSIGGMITYTEVTTERKMAENALIQSESRYRTLVNTIPDLVWLKDLEGIYLSCNPTFERFFGAKESEIIGKTDYDFKDKDLSDSFREHDRKAMDIDGPSVNEEWLTFADDGYHGLFETIKTPMRDTHGNVIGVLGISRDITERKGTEEALIESEQKWRNILVNTPQIGIALDSQARVVFANEHFLNLTGWKEQEVIGQDWFDMFIPENNREEIRLLFSTTMKQKDVLGFNTYENEIVTRSGELRNVAWSNVLTKDTHGNIVELNCLGIDLTERRQAEEALRESREKYRSMVDNIGIGVALISPKMEILDLNRQMRTWFPDIDPSTRSICYRAYNNPPRDKICDYCPTCKTFEDGKVHESTTITPMADGPRNYRIISSPIFDAQDKVQAAIEMVEDITERLELENQLRQAQKLESIGNLAGGIAHDFNNILSSIIGYTELAIDDVEKGTQLADKLQGVYTAGMRARDLVKQIMAFARQSDEERKPIRVDSIAKEALKLIRSTIPTSIEINQHMESNSLIIGNPTQVHQLFMNLCTNAAQAMEDNGGILEVGLTDVELNDHSPLVESGLKPGNYLKATISDTGPGISPDNIGSIFEPYFTTKAIGKGTGLGLATVHGIVETYDGKITVDSESGKGTIFSIYLPITKKSEDYRSYDEEKLPSGTERILFVDDELPIAKMGSQILKRLGYRVTVRTSSLEALELFRAKPQDFDLAITDMTMPNMTGDKLAAELMKIRSDIAVMLCTGYSNKITDETTKKIGIKAVAHKPIVMADLAKTVRKVLDEAKDSAQG